MFEDLEKWLQDEINKPKKRTKQRDNEGEGLFDGATKVSEDEEHDHDHDHDHERMSERVVNKLKEEFGVDVEVIHTHEDSEEIPNLILVRKIETLQLKIGMAMDILAVITNHLNIPAECKDKNDNQIQEGDFLKTPSGHYKKVLQLGVGYCILSNTSSDTMVDGVWFQPEIKARGFIRKESKDDN
jgi:hypothetical protein